MEINFYIRIDKIRKKDGKVPIYMDISSHLPRLRKPTCILISPDNWEPNKKKIRKSEPFALRLNSRLDSITTSIQQLFASDNSLTLAVLELEILKVTKPEQAAKEVANHSGNVDSFVVEINKSQKNELAEGTLKARSQLKNLIEKYANGEVNLADINEQWIYDFRNFMIDSNISNHTINSYISRLLSLLKNAYQKKLVVQPPPIIKSLKTASRILVYLDEEELATFENSEITLIDRGTGNGEKSKDYFIFMCYTGIRFSDFFLLTRANFRKSSNPNYKYVLDYTCKKNGANVVCPLTEKVYAIAEKYFAKNNLDFVFPKIADNSMTFSLKYICKEAGIVTNMIDSYFVGNKLVQDTKPKYELISPHAARHTFATRYISRGGNILYLQKLLGHSSLDMTRSYVEIIKGKVEDEFFSVFGK